LAQLYQDQSLMTYQGDKVQGRANILKKLAELPIRTVKHDIQDIDCQPSVCGGILIFVNGLLKTDDDPPHRFSEVFHLVPAQNSFFITNHLFRLLIG
jgi:hypothetical protein